MQKDFDTWNGEKKLIHAEHSRFYTTREIWWASLGVNVGFEQDGTGVGFQRPVLIVKGMSKETCFIVPLTTSSKRHFFRIPIGKVEDRDASAVISQLRLIDTKRLADKICFLDQDTFNEIRKAVKGMF